MALSTRGRRLGPDACSRLATFAFSGPSWSGTNRNASTLALGGAVGGALGLQRCRRSAHRRPRPRSRGVASLVAPNSETNASYSKQRKSFAEHGVAGLLPFTSLEDGHGTFQTKFPAVRDRDQIDSKGL